MGPSLDALDGIRGGQLSLSASKVLHKEHKAPFGLRLRHALHLFIQVHDAEVVAPEASCSPSALILNLEPATKRRHITPALLQLLDRRCGQQHRHKEFARGELGNLIE